jgi:hypothetical protein
MNLGAAKACAQRVRDKLHRLMSTLPRRGAVEHKPPGWNETVTHVTERSILQAPNIAEFVPFAVAGQTRRATRSGVAWFKGYHLAVVNLYGGHLRISRFHPASVAVGWVASHPGITAPILGARNGARNLEQLEPSLKALEMGMTPELRERVSKL